MASPAVLRERSRALPKLLSHLGLLRFMGGGPRTFPGGLNKWQYKRMHEKMAREKERRLLQQEKQLYQARLRTEIRAKNAGRYSGDSADPASNSGGAMASKEHIKALADRFMKAGAEDLWNEDDGPIRSAPRRSHASGSVPPLDLRKLVAERRNVVESRAGRTSSGVGSFNKREYSTMPGRQNGMRSKMRWRNSSSDEDSESDAGVVSNGNSMKELRDADRGTPKNSRLFPKFSIGSDRESEEDSGSMSRASAEKKIFSRAALRNHDMKTQRRVSRSIEERGDLSSEIQEIRDELRKKQLYAYDTMRHDAEEESLLTKKRLLDHIENKSGFSVRLMGLKMLILDEADHLLDLGYRKDIEKIVDSVPRQRQSVLLSATIPREVEDSIARVDPSIKEAAYHAWLGYYNSIREVGRDKTMLADLANQFCHSIGLEKPPALFRRTALKMGLKGIPGIRVQK
ncbi:hypothetical protein BHE74_00017935 [Ensete ventricosum]|nr:hypothetical protein BHE74_00017935 [Ensete ventricosum]